MCQPVEVVRFWTEQLESKHAAVMASNPTRDFGNVMKVKLENNPPCGPTR